MNRAPWEQYAGRLEVIPFDARALLAPVTPSKIVALAANYEGATGREEGDVEPLVFIKPPSAVAGPNDLIRCPFPDIKVWGESELAIVVGKPLTKATPGEARYAILGYTLANDVTAENVYGRDHHLARSKAVDTFCPVGPWIETDFVPGDQVLQGWHNDTLLRESRLSRRVMKEIDMLVWLSTWLTLEPGDVVLTGAPPRVRERLFLHDGDTYACQLQGLGTLKNTFRLAAP